MAKIKSLFTLSGTMDNKTFVNSRAYDPHLRNKRGTYKKAVVNDGFKASTEELLKAQPVAQLIKNSFNPYLVNFRDGRLWQRLCSVLRMQVRNSPRVNYQELEGLQFHHEHSLNTLLQGKAEVKTSLEGGDLRVALNLSRHPHFPLSYVDAYRLTLVVVAISADNKSSKAMEHVFPIAGLSADVMREQVVHLPADENMQHFIVALKCEGCSGEDVMNNLKTTGMAIVNVVKRPEL